MQNALLSVQNYLQNATNTPLFSGNCLSHTFLSPQLASETGMIHPSASRLQLPVLRSRLTCVKRPQTSGVAFLDSFYPVLCLKSDIFVGQVNRFYASVADKCRMY